jgi:inosose dehydratase
MRRMIWRRLLMKGHVMHRREVVAAALALPAFARALKAPSVQLGYAAITWGGRDDVAVDEIAELGFRGIQLRTAAFSRWGNTPSALVDLLASRRLHFVALSSGLVRLDPASFEDDMALHLRHAQFLKACGGTFLQVVDERPPTRAIADADFTAMARRLDELGRRTADIGITLVYHNHMGNLGQSPQEVEAVLSRCDARNVRLLLDIAHWHAAGGNPVTAVRQYADRIAFLHLKDVQQTGLQPPARSFRFVELGKGEVNVVAVMAELARESFTGWGVVELDAVTDPALTPKACAQISKDYLASIGYTT